MPGNPSLEDGSPGISRYLYYIRYLSYLSFIPLIIPSMRALKCGAPALPGARFASPVRVIFLGVVCFGVGILRKFIGATISLC